MLSTLSYEDRIAAIRATKQQQTEEKQRRIGAMDHDDHGYVLPPEEIKVEVESNHPCGGVFGPRACGQLYRRVMEAHPAYIDPMSSLAGAWMTSMFKYGAGSWNPDISYSHLYEEQQKYNIIHGIGGPHHFAPDMLIGFELGWGGILEKIRRCRAANAPHGEDFYAGEEAVVLGIQNWIARHSAAARAAKAGAPPELHDNLEQIAAMCERLVTEPPATFREACQWIAFFELAARVYNGSGALGQIDEILRPFYERDTAAGILDDEEATFHLACLLVKDPHYYQIGGSSPDGSDLTSRVSFLVLEAAHWIRIPTNIAIRVHDGLDPDLFDLGMKYLFEDKVNSPLFIGDKGLSEGFARNGYPIELARQRVKTGCHWCAIPGREYTLNDIVKINIAKVFDVALREMVADESVENSTTELWARFERHLRRAVEVTAEGMDFHLRHMHEVFPELVLDLLCHGPIEKGEDATHGGVEYYNLCVDGSALATTADSFAAVEQRVEREGRLTWQQLIQVLDADFEGAEDVRRTMQTSPRYGRGSTRADDYALRISQTFTRLVKEKPTPDGHNMIPGLFSWASTIPMGCAVGATPNGRKAHAPISHGSNPDPGFAKDGALTALALAVAKVQPGYGNSAPLQLDIDYATGATREDRAKIAALIKTHFDLGGTQVNINILDKQKLLDAEKHPEKYPDLVVRVTGFSAYFASLSPTFRRWVIERIVGS